MQTLDAFTRSFFETALWSSNDYSDERGGEPLDKSYTVEDIDPKCLAVLAIECALFQAQNEATLASVYGKGPADRRGLDAASAGHDFWLTRCGHGAGFWDGDYPEAEGKALTNAAKAFGNVDLYVGDDGKIYAMGYETGERWHPAT